jgi:hypothetical protein
MLRLLALVKTGHAFETKCGGHRLRQVATPLVRESASDRGFGNLQVVVLVMMRDDDAATAD